MLLRKQTSWTQETFRVAMNFTPRKAGYEAGIVLWWNQFSYATMGITFGGDGGTVDCRTVVTRQPEGQPGEMKVSDLDPAGGRRFLSHANWSSKVCHHPQPVADGEVTFHLTCYESQYVLRASIGEFEHDFVVPAEKLTVAPPVGGTFAGVMYGVYSFGNGEPVLDPADFRDITVTRDRL